MSSVSPPTAERLRAIFDATEPLTVGVEEEVMVLDPETLDLVPAAEEILGAASTAMSASSASCRPRSSRSSPRRCARWRRLPRRSPPAGATSRPPSEGDGDLGEAGVHPFAAAEGELSPAEAYDDTRARYGRVARRQLVFALQVHVAVGGAERTLAVYNALRSYLPELSALAANARWYEGRDSGFASVRPKIAEALPRQGVPPALGSWDEYAAALDWGAASGTFEPRVWWWELRPHVRFGTLEVRVPDAQVTVAESSAVVAFVHALVAWLAARHDAGDPLPVHPRWKIEENRWSAARDGVEGVLADLDSGERRETRARLLELLEQIGGATATPELALARTLIEENGAVRQRAAADARGAAQAIADGFLG